MSFGGRRRKQGILQEPEDISNPKANFRALEDRLEIGTCEPGCETCGSHSTELDQGACVREHWGDRLDLNDPTPTARKRRASQFVGESGLRRGTVEKVADGNKSKGLLNVEDGQEWASISQ